MLQRAQEAGARVVKPARQQCSRTMVEAAVKNWTLIRAMEVTQVVWLAMQQRELAGVQLNEVETAVARLHSQRDVSSLSVIPADPGCVLDQSFSWVDRVLVV